VTDAGATRIEETAMRRQWALGFVLAALVAALPASGAAATDLKLGHCAGLDDPYHIGALKFVELVKAYTRDTVRVMVFPNCQLGSGEREMIEGVKLGTLEMVLTASAPIAGFEPKFMLFDLPFLFRDNAHAHRVLDGPVGQKVAASLEPHGIKLLAWMESGFRNMITTRKRIGAPDDMKGLKFRVMENPVYVSMFRNLGSSGVPIPSPEVYTSLQTGVVDGYEHPVGAYMGIKAYEVAKLVALTGHAYTAAPILMNLQAFRQLPGPEQENLLRAAREAAVYERSYVAKTLEEFKAKLTSRDGVQFYDVDKRPFQQRMAPVYREFEAKVGKDLIDAILQSN
jgi:tripartite ATP-independent transporter DctP family solute receptor